MYAEISFLLLFNLALGAWAQLVVRPQPAGWPRFIRWLPFAISCYLVPSIPKTSLLPAFAGPFTLGAFKLLAFCFNRGPLMLPLSPTQFGVVTTMPLVPSQAFYTSSGSRSPYQAAPGPIKMLWHGAVAYASCLGICSIILAFPNLYWPVRHWLLVLALLQYLEVWGDAIDAVITFLFPMSLAPRFNKPWMSDSIEDFWARRWNLVTTYTFRTLVYEPIMQGHLLQVPESDKDHVSKAPPSSPVSSNMPGKAEDADGLRQRHAQSSDREQLSRRQQTQTQHKRTALRRFIAVEATFILSGVWHMVHFWYGTQMISFKWPMYFIMQAPIIIVERWLARRLALKARVPCFLRIVITNVILIAIGGPIFVRPLEETGLAALYLAKAQKVIRLVSIYVPQSMLPWIIRQALQQQEVLKG